MKYIYTSLIIGIICVTVSYADTVLDHSSGNTIKSACEVKPSIVTVFGDDVTPVPEPAIGMMLLTGMLMLSVVFKKK